MEASKTPVLYTIVYILGDNANRGNHFFPAHSRFAGDQARLSGGDVVLLPLLWAKPILAVISGPPGRTAA